MQKQLSFCDCEFDSQLAYIFNNKTNEFEQSVTILEYINDRVLKDRKKEKLIKLVCQKENELTTYISYTKKTHFRHINCNPNPTPMTIWHQNWQKNFDEKHREIRVGNRRADVLIGNFALEFQHSRIPKNNITDRTNNYVTKNKNVYWILECNKCIDVEQTVMGHYFIYFNTHLWKFENFIDNDYIFLDHEDKIYKIKPKNVKSCMITVGEYKTKQEFIDSIKNGINIWNDTIQIQSGIIYHNQRGAGCGKTYESIQLLQNDARFKDKDTFLYLTKVHSAKEVIYNELMDQYGKGKLSKLEIEKQHDTKGINNKQYKIKFHNNESDKSITIIIGTIDSFAYAIGNKQINDKDYFLGIVKSIKDGHVQTTKTGGITYAKNDIKLNQKCLVLIDEAQDLDCTYIEACSRIINVTNIDAYIIGDKLQSIWGKDNIHTFLENNNLNTTVHKSEGNNKVMRFHNEQFKDIVNKIIDFNKYQLPKIESICSRENCGYKHENEIDPCTIFELPTIYTNDYETDKIKNVINKITDYMDQEIEKYNYLPHNFMFIFPILSKNFLANQLESKLQDYWINKFNNENYQKNALSKNEYWKDKLNDNEFYKYVFLHKSDEGKSINLKESEYATRILSIHASKGNGCEVVFLLGVSEGALSIFSKEKYDNKKDNLVYDSLLHVAMTRQKKSLYVGIIQNCDDIWNRFNSNFNVIKDMSIPPYIENIKSSNQYSNIIDHATQNENNFKIINDEFIIPQNLRQLIQQNQNDSQIIDWGHHLIRYYMFLYYLEKNIIDNEKVGGTKYDELIMSMKNICKVTTMNCIYAGYYDIIRSIDKNNREGLFKKNTMIPILTFAVNETSKYRKYVDIIVKNIRNIQNKMKKSLENNKLPDLCPLECIILLYMIHIINDGSFSDITIMDIYSIMYHYDQCFCSCSNDHPDYCLCKQEFTAKMPLNTIANLDIQKSITKHYEKVTQIKLTYENYRKLFAEKFGIFPEFSYNILNVVLGFKENNNFKIIQKYELIGNSKDYVINFIVKPQFNQVNFSETICKIIFNDFLLKNTVPTLQNFGRYDGKKIVTCIFTLDSIEPIICELNINKNNYHIIKFIKEYLIDNYIKYHEVLYDFRMFWKIQKPKNKDSISHICDLINTDIHKKLPKYIKDYFENVKKEIMECKNNKGTENDIQKILQKVDNKDLFINGLNKNLEYAIDDYLNINNNVNDEYNDF